MTNRSGARHGVVAGGIERSWLGRAVEHDARRAHAQRTRRRAPARPSAGSARGSRALRRRAATPAPCRPRSKSCAPPRSLTKRGQTLPPDPTRSRRRRSIGRLARIAAHSRPRGICQRHALAARAQEPDAAPRGRILFHEGQRGAVGRPGAGQLQRVTRRQAFRRARAHRRAPRRDSARRCDSRRRWHAARRPSRSATGWPRRT